MAILYKQLDVDGEMIAVYTRSGRDPGITIQTSFDGCDIADEEIPGLVSALQNYMSRRAKEITKAAKGAG
jgi:hypothetical protein